MQCPIVPIARAQVEDYRDMNSRKCGLWETLNARSPRMDSFDHKPLEDRHLSAMCTIKLLALEIAEYMWSSQSSREASKAKL
jgi:hypothetical protein